eukprot:scaffold158944_cov41-Cyclotella_meneghiniana.AAC.1
MADDDPTPPLPTPTAQTAIKQAVATAHDAPDHSPVDGDSPLPPRPLFTRFSSLTAEDDIFDNSDDDECLADMAMPPSTSSHSRKRHDNDDEEDEAIESPQKRLKTATDLSSPPPSMSQASLLSNQSPTPVIKRVGDIPTRYFDSDAEDDDSDYAEDMFDIDEGIRIESLPANDPRRIEWNKNKTIHNNIHDWARADSLATQPLIRETDESFKSFERSFSRQIHHRYNETRGGDTTDEDGGIRVTRASSRGSDIDNSINSASNIESVDTRRLSRLMFEDIITVREGSALKLFVSKAAVNNTSAWWQDNFSLVVSSLKLKPIRMHSRDFYVFDVTISCDTEHQGVTSGTTSLPDLEKKFARNDGFHISFNGVSKSDGRPLIIPIS